MPAVDEDSRGPHTGATSVAGSTARTPDAAPPSASGPATAVLPTVAEPPRRQAESTRSNLGRTSAADDVRPAPAPAPVVRLRVGAGLPGFLAVASLAGLAVGLFALPLLGKRTTQYFHQLRTAATRANTGSNSEAGRAVATFWWRYGALIGFAVLAFLVALSVGTTRLRRLCAALLLLAAIAAGVLLALAAYQTADPDKQQIAGFARVRIAHLQIGFWIALGCCGLLALAALLTAARRRVRA
jgi:hypothetical protein